MCNETFNSAELRGHQSLQSFIDFVIRIPLDSFLCPIRVEHLSNNLLVVQFIYWLYGRRNGRQITLRGFRFIRGWNISQWNELKLS